MVQLCIKASKCHTLQIKPQQEFDMGWYRYTSHSHCTECDNEFLYSQRMMFFCVASWLLEGVIVQNKTTCSNRAGVSRDPEPSIVITVNTAIHIQSLNHGILTKSRIVMLLCLYINSLSALLLLNISLSFEVGIAHAIANFKWKENTSSLKN